MTDELLPYYNSELEFLRLMGKEFAKAHPRSAAHLNIGGDEAYDPHVGRLVQAFAYLNARTRHKLDDDFPEISSSMLEILYPHFQRPIPSISVVKFGLDRAQADLTSGYDIKRHSMLSSESIDGQSCRFRTCYPVTCWPIDVKSASYKGLPFQAPQTTFSRRAASLITISLDTFLSDTTFAKYSAEKLRFFIRAQSYFRHDLYELIMNNVVGVAISHKPDGEYHVLQRNCIQPVGFENEEGVLDYPARSFIGYRLLSEFFAFPDKFMFFDLHLGDVLKKHKRSRAEIYIYLDEYLEELEPRVSAETFSLGCTPIINLYKHRAEPLKVTHFDSAYRVIPDSRQPLAHEIYSIEKVTGTLSNGKPVAFQPFYSVNHRGTADAVRYWHASRYWNAGEDEAKQGGTELHLSFVDLNFAPSQAAPMTIDVETTCFNRNLPAHLPFGGGSPRLSFEEGSAVKKIEAISKPSATLRPPLKHETRWRLVSQLSLGHLSLADEKGVEAMREILRLYDYRDSPESRKLIAGLQSIQSRPIVGRVAVNGASGLCRGMEIDLHFDEDQYKDGGLFLMASVLERFLGLYTHINSFTQTKVTTNKRDRVLCKWPPRTGQQSLV
jgi:type VI secretion system protein ImpG